MPMAPPREFPGMASHVGCHECSLVRNWEDGNDIETLHPRPPLCSYLLSHRDCPACGDTEKWQEKYKETVDDLVVRSNVHDCDRYINKDGNVTKKKDYSGCKENKYSVCRARFPRETYREAVLDPETGALNLKKGEPWTNMFTAALTYLVCCNTDVTNLSSGTAIKAVVLYISNYITKTTLKTHVIFDVIRDVFEKNTGILASSVSSKEKARCLMGKIVNLLAVKQEMGAPMLAMYLMGHPDHYMDHQFKTLYWKNYMTEVRDVWRDKNNKAEEDTHKLTMVKEKDGKIVGVLPVIDYMFRPIELAKMSVYQWATQAKRKCIPPTKKKEL